METHHFRLQEGTVRVSPRGFNATMELQAAITWTEKVQDLSGKKDLFSFPVPDLGFEIPHLCKVGVTLNYQIGFSTKFMQSETIVFGATASLPDDAVLTIDLQNRDKATHSGFENAVFRPILDLKSMTSTVKFAVFTQADISFGIDLKWIERADVELSLKIPQLATTIAAGYSKHSSNSLLKGELIPTLSFL